jgi:hypothetical protein
MSATQAPHAVDGVVVGARLGGRLTALRIVAAVSAASTIGFGVFTLVFGIVEPAQEPHAFHNVMVASLLLVLTAPANIAIAVAPQRAIRPLVVLTVVGIGALATMAMGGTVDPFTLPVVLVLPVMWALLPDRDGAYPAGRSSPILVILVLAAAAPLFAYAIGQADLQRTDHASEHAAFYHWVEASFAAVAVLLLGLLAALRPAAYRLAAWCAGVTLAVLGVASVVLGEYASAFEAPWSWLALVGGAAFVAVAEWEARRSRRPTDAGGQVSDAIPT